MRKYYIIFIFISSILCACNHMETSSDDSSIEYVDVEFVASANDANAATKIDFSYDSALQMVWSEGDRLNIFILKSNGSYERAEVNGQPSYMSQKEGTEFDENTLVFAGKARALADGEKYVFTYPPITDEWNGSVASVDLVNGAAAELKGYTFLRWDYDLASGEAALSKQSSIMKFTLAGMLPENADIKSITLAASGGSGNVFMATTDLAILGNTMFRTTTDNITYTFSGLRTNTSGGVDATIFLPTPLANADFTGDGKYYDIHVVCEKNGVITNEKTNRTIAATNAFKQAIVYPVSRGNKENDFGAAQNPGSSVDGGTNVTEPEKTITSVIGPWDDYGRPTDDIYGILSAGENFRNNNQHARLVIQAARNLYTSGSDNINVHGDDFRSYFWTLCGDTGSSSGPQYVTTAQMSDGSVDLDFNNVRIVKDTKVYLTFIGTRAWNKNSLGYYVYPTSKETEFKECPTSFPQQKVQEQLVFPSLSQPVNGSAVDKQYAVIDPMTTVQMLNPEYDGQGNIVGYSATFPAGTTIGFVTRVAKWSDKLSASALNLQSRALYTNAAWNVNNNNVTGSLQGWPLEYSDGSARTINNAIAARRLLVGTGGYEPHCLVYGTFDAAPDNSANYNARFCNPVFLVYTEEENAIDYSGVTSGCATGNNYWLTESDKDFYTISSLNDPNSPVYAVVWSNNTSLGETRRESNFMSATHDKHKWLITTTDRSSLVNIDDLDPSGEGTEYYFYNVGIKQWIATAGAVNDRYVLTANYDATPVKVYRKNITYKGPYEDWKDKEVTVYKLQYMRNGAWLMDSNGSADVFAETSSFDEDRCYWILTRHTISQ